MRGGLLAATETIDHSHHLAVGSEQAVEHILVVDDEEMVCGLLRSSLESEEVSVACEHTVENARKKIASSRTDLVVCDIRLPQESGLGFLQWCRKEGYDMPFILITGMTDADVVMDALNLGADFFLEKPFKISRMKEAVDKALALRRYQRTEKEFQKHLTSTNQLLRQTVTDAMAENQQLFLGCLSALASAIDARDHYTHQHSSSVARLARRTAEVMELGEEMEDAADIAGTLHDIGKLAVPEHILLKPQGLSDDEFDMVKLHPLKSGEILQPVPDLEKCVAAVSAHHERFDGQGYPLGLAGEEIPLLARILCVCDAWDAMTSDRPYRKAMPEENALAVLAEESGTQFDPGVVTAFTRAKVWQGMPQANEV